VLQDSTPVAEVQQSTASARQRHRTALQLPPHRCWNSLMRARPARHVRRTRRLPLMLTLAAPSHLAGQTTAGSRAVAPERGAMTVPGARTHCTAGLGRQGDLAAGPDRCGRAMGQFRSPALCGCFPFSNFITGLEIPGNRLNNQK
jgi:hypothetical protein